MRPGLDERLARALVRVAALLAPPERRKRFVREWNAELWHHARGASGGEDGGDVVGVALGAFKDARSLVWVQGEGGLWTTMGGMMAAWAREFRMAVRALLRAPGFSLAAIVTLGVGLGGSTVMMTLLDRVVLRPLDYPESERLVRLENQVPGVGPDTKWGASTAQYVYFDEHSSALEAVALYRGIGANMDTPSGLQRAFGWSVTASTLPLLGGEAELGRLIAEDDDLPTAPPVAVLSNGFWRRQFGADRDVIGRVLAVNGEPTEIIGVLRAEFRMPGAVAGSTGDMFLPMRINRAGSFGNNHVFNMIGRLAPGATIESAETELAQLTTRLPERFPRAYSQRFFDRYGFRTQATPLKAAIVGEVAKTLWVLLGAVGLVLFAACANVTNLFVVRMEGRRREVGVRAALGAGWRDLARYLLAEGLTLSLASGVLGMAVAFWGLPALLALAPGSLPRLEEVGIGGGVFAVATLVTVLVGIALVVYPLSVHARPSLVRDLASGGARSAGPANHRFRSVLVVTQVALAVTLTASGGLLLESVRQMNAAELGFEPEGVLTARVHLESSAYENSQAMWSTYDRMLERVQALPGVHFAGMSEALPLSGDFGCTVQGFEDETVYDRVRDAGMTTCAGQNRTTHGYFEALGIPVLRGRAMTRDDNDDPSRASVVVSKAFADRFWPGEDPIGKGVGPSGRTEPPFYHVVGVVGDVPRNTVDGDRAMAIYYPVVHTPAVGNLWWWRPTTMSLVVQTSLADPISLYSAVRQAVASVDPQTPVVNARSMEDRVALSMGRLRFVSTLLGIAAGIALFLAAVGMYGVISYVVTRQTGEIGLRMALGARSRDVERSIVGRSLRLAAFGLVTGVILAAVATRALEGMLVGVQPGDPRVLAASTLLLAVVAALASWLPARRAARISPSEALRSD